MSWRGLEQLRRMQYMKLSYFKKIMYFEAWQMMKCGL